MDHSVRTHHVDNVCVIYMSRPDVLNAFNRQMLRELLVAFDEVTTRGQTGALVLTGENGSFTTGEDLRDGAQMTSEDFRELIDLVQAVTAKMRALPFPVIAAIEGFAFGGGLEIAAACDLRIASEGTQFCCPEVNIGQVITNGASVLLPRIMGDGRARELIFTGEVFDAEWCSRAGLVNSIVPAATLVDAATTLARRIATRAPMAVSKSKMLLNAPLEDDVSNAIESETRSVMELFETADSKEGFRAFAERRQPQFDGR